MVEDGDTDELDIRHLSFDRKEGKKKERSFKCKVVAKGDKHKILIPERQLFVQLVRFASGKGPKDYAEFYSQVDQNLKNQKKSTRHDMDIHEIMSLITWGRYDMIVILDAPNAKTYNEFLASYINPGTSTYFGTTETHVVASAMGHPPN